MSKYKNHIDKQIQQKLLQAEIAPPAALWKGIDSALALQKKTATILLVKRFAYAAAVLLIAFLTFYLIRSERNLPPSENKLAIQLTTDSLTLEAETASKKSIELSIPEASTPIEIASIQVNNTAEIKPTNQNKSLTVTTKAPQTQSKRIDYTSERIAFVALRLKHSGELSSFPKREINEVKLFKRNAIKQLERLDEFANLLAEQTQSSTNKGWSIGLAYAPTSIDRGSGIFTPNSDALYADASSEMSFVSEKDIPAYSGGVNLVYQISDRWSFQSGLYYLKQGQRIENFGVLENSVNASNISNSYFGNIIITNTDMLAASAEMANYTQLTEEITFTRFNTDLLQRFELIEIPFIASYKMIDRKTILSVLVGINSGILVGNQVYFSENSSVSIGKTEAVNTFIYKSILGVSVEYPLMRKLYLNFSPTFKYQLNNFNKNAIVSERLNYLEFKTGINYRF
ncbi:MAG: outer membrane beta-barrel protein [Bacteroidales bacterium]|nr:outer membrane beta-barrel protein [Bacteroidales bacterium]